jgi:dTDP-4-amino-4,6-dideoxygalactose transaminase
VMNLAPMHAPLQAELDAVWRTTADSGAFILGEAVARFEREWADYCGTSHCVGVGDGTEAIELALRGLEIGAGSEVIVPASTFIATAAAVVAAGATPVFTDVDPDSLLITADHVRAAITPRTAAVIVVHLYGNLVDVEGISAVAAAAGIAMIEDGAQAHGSRRDGRRAGGFGHAAAFSHYPTKSLGAFGDGGSVVTSDGAVADRVRLISNHGRPNQSTTDHQIVGRTGRLDALQAGILSVKLAHLDAWVEARRDVAQWYDELLPKGLRRIASDDPKQEAAPHLCVTMVDNRDAVREHLRADGIGSAVHYADPVPRTTAFGSRVGEFPVAERAADRVLTLPLWPGMSRQHVEDVCQSLANM